MPFANIRGSLKTDDELDLMLGCIDHETEVVQDDRLITPPINTRYSPGIRRRVLICSHYANLCQRPWCVRRQWYDDEGTHQPRAVVVLWYTETAQVD